MKKLFSGILILIIAFSKGTLYRFFLGVLFVGMLAGGAFGLEMSDGGSCDKNLSDRLDGIQSGKGGVMVSLKYIPELLPMDVA